MSPYTGRTQPDELVLGAFVVEGAESWYRIDGYDNLPPLLMVLAGDSDLWAYVSSAGSLTAGSNPCGLGSSS